ncbi:hypothetical protein F8M41_020245 [Gigaspora margarita]|uniref:Uncharacterized protein n=1 Tax=Gigaspora margarita TaxID=4874 RepID=A0A8H4B1V9_GIGMA|nr:hypothetical protein F8M41_020245 [Gigaspora margarita]
MINLMTPQFLGSNNNVTLQSQINSPSLCRWELLIITNCEGSLYLIPIVYVSLILCITISVLSSAILIYKTTWNNVQIRNIKMDPLKGFMVCMTLYGIFRMVSMLIAVNDWIHDSYIIKSVVAALGSVLGCIAIATYLVSIFKVLPRLALNQHSVFSIDADLPKDHLTANRFIPNIHSVTIIYWTYTIAIFSYTLILSILKGYFQGTGEENPFNIVYTLLNIGLGISDVLGIVCFIKYGRLIIKLLDESATLIGLVDVRNSQHKAQFLKNYHTHLKKVYIFRYIFFLIHLTSYFHIVIVKYHMQLKVMNFSLLLIVCWYGFLGFFIALMRNAIVNYMPLYIALVAISLDGVNFIMLITFLGIIYGEIREKYSVQAEEITISINYSEVNN